MNSVEALDYAIRVVRRHRVIAPELTAKEAAIETLTALRQVILDNDQRLAELTEEARS